jgi:hypothetical protein
MGTAPFCRGDTIFVKVVDIIGWRTKRIRGGKIFGVRSGGVKVRYAACPVLALAAEY